MGPVRATARRAPNYPAPLRASAPMLYFRKLAQRISRRRFRALDIALAILIAGWVPAMLMGYFSYRILSKTLEEKVVIDRSTLVRTLSHLLGLDLIRTGSVMEYYQTFPRSTQFALRDPGDPEVQQWLTESFFPMGWIDGMFLTDAAGKLIAASPLKPELIGRTYQPEQWKPEADATGYQVSGVHQRLEDGRYVASVVVALRTASGEVAGYMGADLLVDRMGRRLSNLQLAEQSVAQVFDQNGFPLFTGTFMPNTEPATPYYTDLYRRLPEAQVGHFRFGLNLYVATEIEGTEWTAVLEQPLAVAYAPVNNLIRQMVIAGTCLVGGTLVIALIVSQLYRRQVEADERIARATLFNEKILANMPTGIALVDPETRQFVQANQTFTDLTCRFAGRASGCDIVGSAFTDVQLGLEEKFEQVAEFGSPYQSREQKLTAPDGSEHYLNMDLLRLQDAQRRTRGILFLLADKTAEVIRREELIAANTAKDQFLALLSHELRNPLSPVITMTAELERLTAAHPDFREPLEVIRRNVELEARLIDDLLDITRITHGKLQLNRQQVDLHETLRRAVEICESDIAAKKLTLDLRLDAQRHHAWGDPARLQQVFWNVIKNSVKFTSEGALTIRSENRDDRIAVTIRDTGIGIEAERIGKIFNAFEQGGGTITRRFGGLGLGLAITRALVEAHEGTIEATSEGEGTGAMFTVELPAVEPSNVPDESDVSESAGAEASSPRAHRLLVVDDHIDTCHGMRKLLERRGYSIEVAHNVADALALAKNHRFDLLISDLGLPDATGFDLMAALRERYGMRGIALSGYGMESDIERSRAAGFSEHMIKPVNIDRLEEALKRLL